MWFGAGIYAGGKNDKVRIVPQCNAEDSSLMVCFRDEQGRKGVNVDCADICFDFELDPILQVLSTNHFMIHLKPLS